MYYSLHYIFYLFQRIYSSSHDAVVCNVEGILKKDKRIVNQEQMSLIF